MTDILLGLLLITIGFGSFALGRLSGLSAQKSEVRICTLEGSTLSTETSGEAATDVVLTPTKAESRALVPATQSAAVGTAEPTSAEGSYVASKSGKAYHLPWCSGAQRIKPENKVWFASKEAAEAAGYQPAANCKGL